MLDMLIDVNKLSILNVLFTFPENAGPMPAAAQCLQNLPHASSACILQVSDLLRMESEFGFLG